MVFKPTLLLKSQKLECLALVDRASDDAAEVLAWLEYRTVLLVSRVKTDVEDLEANRRLMWLGVVVDER